MAEMTREQKYATTRDEELVLLAQSGDEEAQEFLLDKYKFLVRAKSRAYFLIGADNEDIIQEGMIGLYKAVRDYNEEKNASFHSFAELCVNRQMITAIKAATRQKHQPLNSYVSLNKPVYEEESEQTYMDLLQSGALLNPEVLLIGQENKSFLEHQMMKKLSSFETTVGKTGDYVESRTENIRVGTERFNRLTVAPGKSVSFNKVALKRTAANGYQAALEIAYGNYVEGIGGGICQVSSTLYNAVVNAGLTVNKRTPHAIPSSYVDKGKDATVSDDRYDFVFTNNTGANIYIETQFVKVKGYWTSRFIIYGRPDPNGYTYKLDSQVVETLPLPEPTYKKDNNGEYVIYDDETYQVSKGREGYVVDVYLVTMDSNGLEISREKKYTDTYKAAAPIYYVGVTPRETPIPDTPSLD